MLFPQLVGAVHVPFVNTYGSIVAYVIGLILRITGGESLIGLPAVIKYPFYDYKSDHQNFPFRTMAMIISFLLLLSVSYLTNYLFDNGILSEKYDFLHTLERREKKKGVSQPTEMPMQKKFTKKVYTYDNSGMNRDN